MVLGAHWGPHDDKYGFYYEQQAKSLEGTTGEQCKRNQASWDPPQLPLGMDGGRGQKENREWGGQARDGRENTAGVDPPTDVNVCFCMTLVCYQIIILILSIPTEGTISVF